LLCQLS